MFFLPFRLLIVLVTFYLALFSLTAHAVRVPDLYEAMVPVQSQNPDLRNVAIRNVLKAVVTKVTGQDVLPAYFDSNSLSVQHLAEQFGYESQTQNGERQLYLWARLNPRGVQQIIRDQGLPIWPEERPLALIWLAIEDASGRQVLAEGSEHEAMILTQAAAKRRGLPIVMPIMDLAESAVIDYTVVSGMQIEALAEASEKYASQHILVGHIQQLDGELWRGRWLVVGQAESPLTTPSGPLADVISAGVNPLASRIAQQFSSFAHNDGPQYIEITIDDIRGAADYGRSLQYLKSLSLISQVDVTGVDQQGVHFRLHTRADIGSVMQVISIGRTLYARDVIDQLVFGLNP